MEVNERKIPVLKYRKTFYFEIFHHTGYIYIPVMKYRILASLKGYFQD